MEAARIIGGVLGLALGAANGEQALPADKLARLEQHKRLCELGRAIAASVAG